MATHCSILAWKITWMEKPGRLKSMGLQRVTATQLSDWHFHFHLPKKGASLVAQTVKNPPAVQEMQVQSVGREDPLEKEVATHSYILAWEISWTEPPGGLQGCNELDT